MIIQHSEFQKEKALMEQRVIFYEQSLSEVQHKDEIRTSQVLSNRNEHLAALKSIKDMYEEQNQELLQKIERL